MHQVDFGKRIICSERGMAFYIKRRLDTYRRAIGLESCNYRLYGKEVLVGQEIPEGVLEKIISKFSGKVKILEK